MKEGDASTQERKRKALGRGLEALLPTVERRPAGSSIPSVPMASIDPDPSQPRQRFAAEELEDLVKSVKSTGVIQPIIVRPTTAGRFRIVAGERRWRAAQKAGLAEIPAIVRRVSEEEALLIQLIENLHREDLNPMEVAAGCRRVAETFGYTQERIAEALGKSRVSIANTMRLLALPEGVQKMIAEETLSEGHGRAILLAESPSLQSEIARMAAKKGLTVRATEMLARQLSRKAGRGAARSRSGVSPEIKDLAEQIMRSLGARVEIRHSKSGKGSLVIHYSSLDELDGILGRFMGSRHR